MSTGVTINTLDRLFKAKINDELPMGGITGIIVEGVDIAYRYERSYNENDRTSDPTGIKAQGADLQELFMRQDFKPYLNTEQECRLSCGGCTQDVRETLFTVEAGLFESYVNQEEADEKAQVFACENVEKVECCKWANSTQMWVTYCPRDMDGDDVTLTLPENTLFSSVSQEEADEKALALAQCLAKELLDCYYGNDVTTFTSYCSPLDGQAESVLIEAGEIKSYVSKAAANVEALHQAKIQSNSKLECYDTKPIRPLDPLIEPFHVSESKLGLYLRSDPAAESEYRDPISPPDYGSPETIQGIEINQTFSIMGRNSTTPGGIVFDPNSTSSFIGKMEQPNLSDELDVYSITQVTAAPGYNWVAFSEVDFRGTKLVSNTSDDKTTFTVIKQLEDQVPTLVDTLTKDDQYDILSEEESDVLINAQSIIVTTDDLNDAFFEDLEERLISGETLLWICSYDNTCIQVHYWHLKDTNYVLDVSDCGRICDLESRYTNEGGYTCNQSVSETTIDASQNTDNPIEYYWLSEAACDLYSGSNEAYFIFDDCAEAHPTREHGNGEPMFPDQSACRTMVDRDGCCTSNFDYDLDQSKSEDVTEWGSADITPIEPTVLSVNPDNTYTAVYHKSVRYICPYDAAYAIVKFKIPAYYVNGDVRGTYQGTVSLVEQLADGSYSTKTRSSVYSNSTGNYFTMEEGVHMSKNCSYYVCFDLARPVDAYLDVSELPTLSIIGFEIR